MNVPTKELVGKGMFAYNVANYTEHKVHHQLTCRLRLCLSSINCAPVLAPVLLSISRPCTTRICLKLEESSHRGCSDY